MKNLVLKEMLMISESERAARRVTFDPKATVIKGGNDTGKSSLIKTIYHTLGATPPNIHPKWKSAKVRSAVTFSVANSTYTMLRDQKRLTIFDAGGAKIKSFDSITNDLAPYFATLFDFRLQLRTKQEGGSQALPAFLFLPFYVDQDQGWSSAWASFTQLGQFSRWKRDVVLYHTGVKPNAYYLAQLEVTRAEREMEEIKAERTMLDQIVKRVDTLVGQAQFNLDLQAYEAEIERLLAECNRLKAIEEQAKAELVDLYNHKSVIENQIVITAAAADEIGKDFSFAVEHMHDIVDCPTCGASYENKFSERFDMAADEDRCRTLLGDLKAELRELEKRMTERRAQTDTSSAEMRTLSDLLNQTTGEVKLHDLLKSEGRKDVRAVLEKEIVAVDAKVGTIDRELERAKTQVKLYDDRKRAREINGDYVKMMRRSLMALAVVNLPEAKYKRLDANIEESGSDLPRALLAYYISILHTIRTHSSSTFCPVVIDSPKQQDQDDENWKRILTFIRDDRPKDCQLVLGLVDDVGISFGGKVTELTDNYHVLSQKEYEDVAEAMRPMIDASLTDG